MSGTTFNVTSNRAANESGSVAAGSGGGGGNGALGGFTSLIEVNPTADTSTTSASFVDIAGLSNQSFTTPVSGTHTFTTQCSFYSNGGCDGQLQLVIDDSTTIALPQFQAVGTSEIQSLAHIATTTLTAGSHTVRLQWRRVSGASTLFAWAPTNAHWKLLIAAQGSGINGLDVVENQKTSNTGISTTLPSYAAISGHSLSVTVLQSERIEIKFNGRVTQSGANGGVGWGYRIDGGSTIPISNSVIVSGEAVPVNFSVLTAPLSAGSHTIDLMMGYYGAGTTTLDAADSDNDNKFQIVRYKTLPAAQGATLGEDSLTSDFSTSSTSYVDTGLDVTITTLTNEKVTFEFSGNGTQSAGGADASLILGLSVDGAAEEGVVSISNQSSLLNYAKNISFSRTLNFSTPGAHTVKLRMKTDNGATTQKIVASSSFPAKLQALQFRGGYDTASSFVGSISTQQSINGSDTDRSSSGFTQVNSVQCAIITTIPNEVVEVTYSGNVQFLVQTAVSGQLGYSLDGGTTVVGWYQDREATGASSTSGCVMPAEWTTKVTIPTVGSHTIRLMARESAGGTMRVLGATTFNQALFQVTQYGGGAKLVTVTETSLASDFTITQAYSNVAGGNMAQVDSVQVTVNTIAGERVLISFNGTVSQLGGGFRDAIMGYQIDSDTAVICFDTNHETTSGQQTNASFCQMSAALSAGSHTIKLMAAKANTNGAVVLGTGTGAYAGNKFQVTQFGGDNQASSWISFTPTGSWTTNTTYTGWYRKIGDTLECRIQLALSGAPTAANLTVNLPAGFTIDTSKMLSTVAQEELVGDCYILDFGVNRYRGMVTYNSTTSVFPFHSQVTGSKVVQAAISNTDPFTVGSSDKVWVNFKVPVL